MPFSISNRVTATFATLIVCALAAILLTELLYYFTYPSGQPVDFRLHQVAFWHNLTKTLFLVLQGTVLVFELLWISIGIILGLFILIILQYTGIFSGETEDPARVLIMQSIKRAAEIGRVDIPNIEVESWDQIFGD